MANDIAAAKKRVVNRLVVEEPTTKNDDNSICSLHPATMENLSIFHGDIVLLKGKRRCDTVCMVLPDKECGEGKVRINKTICSNLWVRLADVVSVHPCHDARYGARLEILPLDDTVKGLAGDLFEVYLKPYFVDAYCPIRKGDCGGTVQFKPAQVCLIVTKATVIDNTLETE